MTKILPSGIEAKTGYTINPLISGANRHYVELGETINWMQSLSAERPQNTMLDAVLSLGEAFNSEELEHDLLFNKFKTWLSTFEVKVTYWLRDWNDRDNETYLPQLRFAGAAVEEDLEYDFDDPGPTVEVLGQELSRNDLIAFTHYLMTNSRPEGPQDPRYAFIESLKET